MKILYKNLKNSWPIFLLLMAPIFSQAKDVATVTDIKGRSFAMKEGKLWELKTSDPIEDFSEITTEEGSQISIADNNGNKVHLSGSGHIKILNHLIELKRGYIWVQVNHPGSMIHVQTANSQTVIESAEAIVSFDNSNGKSQVLSVTGDVAFANILKADFKTILPPGHFSFVYTDYEDGMPRRSTPVGYTSFKKIVRLFSGVKPLEKNQKLFPEKASPGPGPARGIASLVEMEEEKNNSQDENKNMVINESLAQDPNKRNEAVERDSIQSKTNDITQNSNTPTPGKVIIIKNDQEYKKVKSDFSVEKFYQKEIAVIKEKKRKANPYSHKTSVGIHIFGQNQKYESGKSRAPASVLSVQPEVSSKKYTKKNKLKAEENVDYYLENYREPAETKPPTLEPFEKSLLQEYKHQLRHSNEVKDLIDELKSYDQDFKKSY